MIFVGLIDRLQGGIRKALCLRAQLTEYNVNQAMHPSISSSRVNFVRPEFLHVCCRGESGCQQPQRGRKAHDIHAVLRHVKHAASAHLDPLADVWVHSAEASSCNIVPNGPPSVQPCPAQLFVNYARIKLQIVNDYAATLFMRALHRAHEGFQRGIEGDAFFPSASVRHTMKVSSFRGDLELLRLNDDLAAFLGTVVCNFPDIPTYLYEALLKDLFWRAHRIKPKLTSAQWISFGRPVCGFDVHAHDQPCLPELVDNFRRRRHEGHPGSAGGVR